MIASRWFVSVLAGSVSPAESREELAVLGFVFANFRDLPPNLELQRAKEYRVLALSPLDTVAFRPSDSPLLDLNHTLKKRRTTRTHLQSAHVYIQGHKERRYQLSMFQVTSITFTFRIRCVTIRNMCYFS